MKFEDWLRRKINNWLNDVKVLDEYKCKVLIHARFFGEEDDYQIVDLSRYKDKGIAVLENHYTINNYVEDVNAEYTFIQDAILYKSKIKNVEIWSYRDE